MWFGFEDSIRSVDVYDTVFNIDNENLNVFSIS